MKSLVRVLLLTLASLAFAAPSALAADDPTCDVQGKTEKELRAMLASPTLDEYCPPGTADEVEAALGDKDTGGAVSPGTDEQPSGEVAPANDQAAEVSNSDNLPFTGAEIGTFLVLGGALVLTGLVLRRGGSGKRTT